MTSPGTQINRSRVKNTAGTNFLKNCRKEFPYAVMAIPALVFFIVFLLLPLLEGVPISFTDWDGISPVKNNVGFANYIKLFQDRYVRDDTINTLYFTVIEVVFCNVFGLLMAIALQQTTKFNNVCRTLVFMPHVISLLLSAYMVRYIFNEIYNLTGVVNMLGVKQTVIPGMALIAIWRDAGYCMVIYLAALQGVDPSMYEVALIEGASKVQRFFKITIPLIVPSITANVTLLTAWGLKLYDYPMAATDGGGPGRVSESVNILIYKNIFPWWKAGYGQAMAIVWVIIIFLITQGVQTLLRRKEVTL